jgi:hypothetical protein
MTTTITTHRELILQISEINETKNAFKIALNLMLALKNNEITSNEYDLLCGELFYKCNKYNIETCNEICSLF